MKKLTQNKKTVTAQLPESIFNKLDALAKAENRSKSYYIKKSLEFYLDEVQEDIKDIFEARKRYDAFLSSDSKGKTLKEMKAKYQL